jgi:MSHA biogenesis protein MshP
MNTADRQKEKGFAAMAALFLLVGLAALGGFMVSFSNAQHLTHAQDVQGTRAYWAARAGLEWGIGMVVQNNTCPGAATTNLAIEGFNVAVTCGATTYVDNGNRVIYQFRAMAAAGNIERSVSAAMER